MSSVTTDDDDGDGDVGDVEVFVYVARAPLHPGRFARALADNFTHVRACGASIAGARASSASSASSTTSSVIFRGVFRATGVVWIASRPNVCGTLRFDATAAEEEDVDDENNNDDENDDDENVDVAPRTTIIDVDCGAGDWSSCERGACDLPPGADARYAGGDRRQHVVFEGFDMDAQAIKACLDACLLTKEEDEDAINRGGDDRSDTVYCAKSWPSAADVNAEAGVEVVDRAAKHKLFYPTTTATMANSAAVPDAPTTASGSVITLGGDVGVLVREAFDAPKTGEPQSKTFASDVVGHYFPDMPCLRCGAPWWLGESWNSTCANCGADDRCYDANQQPLRLHRRKYGEFMRALERLALDVE